MTKSKEEGRGGEIRRRMRCGREKEGIKIWNEIFKESDDIH
jgi:hypothetical protein